MGKKEFIELPGAEIRRWSSYKGQVQEGLFISKGNDCQYLRTGKKGIKPLVPKNQNG
jgi:hypothetical protein